MREKKKLEKKYKTKQTFFRSPAVVCGATVFCFAFFLSLSDSAPPVSAGDSSNEIENALFARQEFFGSRAIVPLPTAEARANLAVLAESQPDNPQILEKLAELEERLWNFDEAERILLQLSEIDSSKLESLAAFFNRRAEFEKEAEILRKILLTANAEKRPQVFERLLNLAQKHDLKSYLQPEFYAETIRENPNVFQIFEQIADRLFEDENYEKALKFVREAKTQFPARRGVLLEREIRILLGLKKVKEAETVYQAAFDPFWSDEEAEKFYAFLSDRDRLRAYGAELKTRFKRNPADFDAAVRLALYRNHDYFYGNDDLAPIILKMEQAKKDWTSEELVTVTRLLIRASEAETASRFLYTLFLREDFKKTSELRAKILYQLFEMFSDAEKQKLPLTRGDLRFYEDAAKTDASPGIATGILSLIFSDTNPRGKLDEQELEANRYFNRAAAYKIFLACKEEFPASPELAQMYLDIVRLYAATKEPEIAETILNEFERRYENSSDYPAAALKLADAFTAVNRQEKTREIYQKVLDYLGRQGSPLAPEAGSEIPNDLKTEILIDRNAGINIPSEKEKTEDDYYEYRKASVFRDYLARETAKITYAEVLDKLVASLAKEREMAEILALYSNEIQKYPDEEWLYERRLSWLEQTNLAEDQLKVYQTALARFQSRGWRDKLARWFLRQNRQSDFAELSNDLVEKLNDREVEEYLSEFAARGDSATEFQKQLYLKLYQSAQRRFPHNPAFVGGLLRFYKTNKQETEWRKLAAEYYFEFREAREHFLDDLARKGELRLFLEKAKDESAIYELFRADASARLSNYENAVAAYGKLNELYPNTPEFSERLLAFTRSFGQKNLAILNESANLAQKRADFLPSSAEYRTRSGEIYAELGFYEKSRGEWEKLIAAGAGEKETYLDAATVYWDYFQYDDALRTIRNLREKTGDAALYAFESGAILESQHMRAEAVGEYVKALGASGGETQKKRAVRRLAVLYNRENKNARNELGKTIDAAFSKENARRDDSFPALGYAEFLSKTGQNQKAESVLKRAVLQTKNRDFIESAKDFYQSAGNNAGEQFVLKRLADVAESPRQKISCRLRLAEAFEEDRRRDSARAVLTNLVREFPTNYGVLTESADFLYRLGFENESVAVLQNALARSSDKYRFVIARKLSERLIRLDRLDAARQILAELREKDKADAEIFGELAKVYVRLNDAESLRKTFRETIAALKTSDADYRETNEQIADLRGRMIDAFTRLKDYKSAVEQHIEIINKNADDEELTEEAIKYVRRYGGGERLLEYYQTLAAQSFKDYRWNVVLARICEARGDSENAARNYRAAILNQPEMPELYVSLADVETKRNDFDAALENLDEALSLTNDAPEYVKKKIEILKKAGRNGEIEAEKAKLPQEEKLKIKTDQFTEAARLQNVEREKSRRLYREGFAALLENPLGGEFSAAIISGYVECVREEEPLDRINERLWTLRRKFVEKADEIDSADAGKARARLTVLDNALIESVGGVAKTIATDKELSALHADLQDRVGKISAFGDNHQTLSLIIDFSRRAGFGDLEEKILLKKLESANPLTDGQIHLQNLVNFYNERGAYRKTFELLNIYDCDSQSLKAETARLAGDRGKELEALRAIYNSANPVSLSLDSNVARYLEILYAQNNGEELKSLTEKSSAYQLQLINFLLGKGEREMAHSAVERANLSDSWKISRHAETSLALKEFGDGAECYFCDALQFESIGNLTRQIPDKKRFLVGDDWFRLTREYGEWLYERGDKTIAPRKFLTAMIENQPRGADEQFKLGEFYLEKNELNAAIEHFRLALEIEPRDKTIRAHLGAAYYLAERKDWAEDSWAKALEDKRVDSGLEFFSVLRKYGLAEKARETLSPRIVGFLGETNARKSVDFPNLIRAVAGSFGNEREKSAYFLQILNERPNDAALAEILVGESLIDKAAQNKFYELLINRSGALGSSDYDYDYGFASAADRAWTRADAESISDQETDYETEQPDNERFHWQMKYLRLLVEQGANSAAEKLIFEIERELKGRYKLPPEARLAKIRIGIRRGKFDAGETERFTGISVSESVTNVKPPSLERFNDVLRVLNEENRPDEARQISESFFARMIALGQFNTTYLTGLSRSLFRGGETEKALRVLQLTIDLADETKRETALAEFAALDIVKNRAADAAKSSENETINSINQSEALKNAAEISAEFRRKDAAINFRRRLLEINPNDFDNQIELAEILAERGEKAQAAEFLAQIVGSRNSPRASRWRARMNLLEMGENTEFPDNKFDAFSQFYNGLISKGNNRVESAAEYFVNSLIAEKDADTSARYELIKLYAVLNKPFAVLKLSESGDKYLKSDELLELLSEAAEKTGDYARAINLEKAKTIVNGNRVAYLQSLSVGKNRRATDFTIDLEKTRKL